MRRTLEVLNQMEREGVFTRYAIGGAVGALFYIEPILTFDLDVFVFLPQSRKEIVRLDSVYDWLRARGYQPEKETIQIEGVPVQFIPAYNQLIEEALAEAVTQDYEGVRTRVMRPEHLIAIMLQTGRIKDRERLSIFREEAKYDPASLDGILTRHGLRAKWEKWARQT
jgi:Nucleotidyl transferase of unknown function (DUF2204)